jgi:hypothetical protein
VEAYLAEQQRDDARTLTYFDIGEATGIGKDLVRELLQTAGGGHNGITLAKK